MEGDRRGQSGLHLLPPAAEPQEEGREEPAGRCLADLPAGWLGVGPRGCKVSSAVGFTRRVPTQSCHLLHPERLGESDLSAPRCPYL